MRAPWEPFAYHCPAVYEPTSTTLLIASLAATAVGTAVSVVSSIQQGNAAKKAAQFNQAANARNAEIAKQQAQQDAELQDRQARQRIGAMRAAYGAAGIDVAGSPLDVLEDSARSAALDRQTIEYKGSLRALGYTDAASLDEARGANAQAAGYTNAASSFLTGAGKAFKMGSGLLDPTPPDGGAVVTNLGRE